VKKFPLGVAVAILASTWASAQFVQQGPKLVGIGAVGQSFQGSSVALAADGSTLLVGASADDLERGAAWVFVRSGDEWTQQAKLVGAGSSVRAQQGDAVALSADGNTAVVGGGSDSDLTGAVWVFTRSNGLWTQQGDKLVGTGGQGPVATQGRSVALSAAGNTLVVGGPYDNGHVGAVWVFSRSNGVWTQQGAKLVATDGVGPSEFGTSVAVSADGNTLVIGGPHDNAYSGAAWVFTRSEGVWTQQGDKLVGTGALGTWAVQGTSVALSTDGNTAIVAGADYNPDPLHGGIGAAWVFTRSNGVWSQQAKLVHAEPIGGGQWWRSAVALSGDGNAAIGGAGGFADEAGAACVYTRSGSSWTQLGDRLDPADAVGKARFGASVAVSADGRTAAVGGYWDNSWVGATWVFTRSESQSQFFWVPVVAHNPGLEQSQWRSDLGLLNTGTATANVQLKLYGSSGVVTNSTYVPAGAQSILVDVVGQFAATGQGALEVVTDQPLRVTSRTYNQVSSGATCYPNGTQGQGYPTLTASDGLSESQSAWLPHLTENSAYRTNIGLVNTGPGTAVVTVELYNGAGVLLASYTTSLASGEWQQETQPFRNRAGQTAMDRGYAKVTVTSGAGVVALASVVDNVTNDPTAIVMQE
jgi:hypothetical protein